MTPILPTSGIRPIVCCPILLLFTWVGIPATTPSVTFLAHASAPAARRPPRASPDQIEALKRVLTAVAIALDDLERQATAAQATIDTSEPTRIHGRHLKDVQGALRTLGLGQLRAGDDEPARIIADLDRFLIRAHVKYKELKAANGRNPYIEEIDRTIHDLLQRRGRLQTMSAVVRAGFALADAGSGPGVGAHEPQASDAAAGKWPDSVRVLWGTKHWNDEEWPIDFGLSGQVAMVPVPALFAPVIGADQAGGAMTGADAQAAGVDDAGLLALHQPSLLYEAYVNANLHLRHSAEAVFFIGGGQTRFLHRDANIDAGADRATVRLVDNGVGLSAYRYQWGLEYRLYDQDMDVVHHEKALLSPIFSAGVGYRHNERFTAWPELAAGRDSCDDPRDRMFWSIDLDLRGVVDLRKGEDTAGRTFSVRPFGGARVGRRLSVDQQRASGVRPQSSATIRWLLTRSCDARI